MSKQFFKIIAVSFLIFSNTVGIMLVVSESVLAGNGIGREDEYGAPKNVLPFRRACCRKENIMVALRDEGKWGTSTFEIRRKNLLQCELDDLSEVINITIKNFIDHKDSTLIAFANLTNTNKDQ